MSFVVELPTQFKQNAQLPNILGNTILTGNETIRGGLQVNGSLTIGEGTTSTSQSTFESMDISTNLIVRQQSTLNTLVIESSLNVIGHSNFSDVSINSLDISNNLQVNGTSNFIGHIQAINISGENVDISENLIVSNHLQGTDISCTKLEGTKGIIQDISLTNMTIDQNLYIHSQNLYLEDLNQTLSDKLSSFTNQISTASTGQVTVNFSFMAKSNSSNVDACLNTILPFNALDLSGCFIEPPNETENYDNTTYKYKMTASSSGIWNFGVKLLAVNTSSPENFAIGLFKNNDLIIQSHISHNSFHLSCLVDCSTNDEIYVKCTQGTGFINMDVSNSCFFGNRTTFSSTSINDDTNLRLNSLELSGGNFQLDTGNVILNQGDISMNSGNIVMNSGDISMNSGHIVMNSGHIIANQITTSQLSINSNMDLCGNLSIQSSDYSISNERLMFDTIVVRRVTDNNNNTWPGINEIQLWVNGDNKLPDLVTDSSFNVDGTSLADISNIPFFIDWSDKTSSNYNGSHYPSNIANETINRSAQATGGAYSNETNVNVGLYVPLTSFINVNDVQSLVIYSRVNHDQYFTGVIVEFYNRSNDSTLSTPIISTPETISESNTNRFDFPSLYTYNSFVSSASITNIIDSSNSAVYNVASKKIVNSSNLMSSIKSTHENDLSFDTIVIRRPTGYSGDTNFYLNLYELQVWVSDNNILPQNATSFFSLWDDKDNDIGQYSQNYASNAYDENISETGLANSAVADDDSPNGALIIKLNDTSITDGDSSSFISYYTFDESFNDTTTNNYHLDIRSGSPEISTTQYKFGSSLYFNGSSTLETSDFTLHNRSFSIALWVYAISAGTFIEQIKASTLNQYLHIVLLSDRNYRFGFLSNDLDTPSYTFNLNEWHHVVFQVKSNGNREIYYNGSLVASDSNTSLLDVDDNPIIIGDTNGQFNGYIDDLRFYNRELTTSEIDDIYTYKGFSLTNIPTNINDIQSLVLYNRTLTESRKDRAQGLAIELYNRYNDPSLNVILASTKIISETANVYRFDFPSIYTYTKGFAKGDSTYQIASSSHALTEVFSPNDVIGLTLDNCKMGITTFHDYINVEGSIHTNGQVVITNQSTDDNKYFMKYNIDDSNYWKIYTNSSDHIYYNYGGNDRGFISSSGSGQMNNFTGQHRCFIKDLPTISNEHIGLIVCANQNVYISMNEVKYGNEAITQNESLPYVSLCIKNNDKSCFGVISASEDPNIRKDEYGSFVSVFQKEKGDTRIYINSVGEGALWIINKNGVLESGDYITTCDISGYGMKQTSDDLKNYSVAKITMDCDFNPSLIPKQVILKDSNGENILNVHNQMQWTNDVDVSGNIVYEYQYKIKYINQDASEISQQEYIDQSNNAYIAAYVGCTYHCG